MFSYVLDALRWRATRGRVHREAGILMRRHGDAALFRALDLLRQAERRADRRQVHFWQAVAHEAAHQVRRRAILESIMCPPPAEPQEPKKHDAAHAPPTRSGSGHIRLVHPAPPNARERPRDRRTPGRPQERQRWRGPVRRPPGTI